MPDIVKPQAKKPRASTSKKSVQEIVVTKRTREKPVRTIRKVSVDLEYPAVEISAEFTQVSTKIESKSTKPQKKGFLRRLVENLINNNISDS